VFTRFFIERPIFANVIAIVTMIIGGVAVFSLPIEQFPQVTPPTVSVTTVYPGANAQTVADTVAAPIEQQVNGVEGMLYMSSTSASDGSYNLTVTFDIGTDLDLAQVLVQNRVAIAEPLLPDEVKRQGVSTKKRSTSIVLVVTLTSPNATYDSLFLSNYATLRIRDELSRVRGVGDVTSFGAASYSMRVWLDPEKLKARSLTTQDVLRAISEQNVQVAAGQIGQPPASAGQNFQYTITTLGRLSDIAQFENIIVKTGEARRVTYLKDVARVELGGQVYDQYAMQNGVPAASLAIFQLPGANALNVAHDVRAMMERLSRDFPDDVAYNVPFDTTIFVEESIYEVYKTLFEAGALVLIVILVFLQDWRAVLVPATTVPVTIIGAFAILAALGFSVNMLTLFGLVLAIGIVVDDAIVIVENAAHHIDHDKLDAKSATIKAMGEVLGPIIGITFVLMAVFLPASFQGGVTGQLYRQFALTIAATALISAVNALTLKPAQCAVYLRPTPARKNIVYRAFNAVYDRCERLYTWIVGKLVRMSWAVLLLYVALVGLTAWWYTRLPTGFLPIEDQGYLITAVQLPDAASQQRTRDVVDQINAILAKTPGIDNSFAIGGYSLLDGTVASNAATFFVVFAPWEERERQGLSQNVILERLRAEFNQIEEGIVYVFPPPAIQGLGTTGGFQVEIEDRGGVGLDALGQITQEIITDGSAQSGLTALNSTFRPGVPQLFVDVDRLKAKTLDLSLQDVFTTLQAYLGSAYVNDFNLFGRTYQVRVQADYPYRATANAIAKLEVRNQHGQMVPLGTIVDVQSTQGPQTISRYNLYPAALITGEAAPGYSSGDALRLMENLLGDKLPRSISYEWTAMSYQEQKVSGEAIFIFTLAVVLVYLVLAAQYESWLIPAAVILVVPLGLLGAVAAVSLRAMDNNVYTQIGIVLIIALASKNAILIVEFARDLRRRGLSIHDAAISAARLRFRPILMTSIAFIMGVVPLVWARGAGAASRQALGTAVFGGMIAATVLAVFFVPVFYVVFQQVSELRSNSARARSSSAKSADTAPEAAIPGAS
jgi:HAE1 family hydrophobic/amphiphilic exporter-1